MTDCSVRSLLYVCLLLAGCQGTISGKSGRADAFICNNTNEVNLGTAPVRRLTNTEYENTVRDLFGGYVPALPEQPDDAAREGTFENDARVLGPSDVRTSRYEMAAITLGEFAVSDGNARSHVLPCSTQDASCGRQFITQFGRRAFRRPLDQEETGRWVAFFEEQRTTIDFDAAVQLTVAAMLQTPHFLYRLELGDAAVAAGKTELRPFELASRLSYFLWESAPDEELLQAAESGELSTDDALEAQARRLLSEPRAHEAVRNFARQWLHLDRVLGEDKAEDLFPIWSQAVQESVYEESMRFVENTVMEGGTLSDLLTSNIGYLDDATADLYGVAPPQEPWGPVELDPNERAGILSRLAFLAGNAHEANGSPPLRGIYVMERLLCEVRPSPPANADLSVPEAPEGEGPFTNRDLFEIRTAPAGCQACHVRIDGFGFGFEQYDAAGIFRTEENGLSVDATGYADGIGNDAPYDSAVELQALLAESDVVGQCVVRKWLTYSLGRELESPDACYFESVVDTFGQNGGSLEELLLAIVLRPEFRLRPTVQE